MQMTTDQLTDWFVQTAEQQQWDEATQKAILLDYAVWHAGQASLETFVTGLVTDIRPARVGVTNPADAANAAAQRQQALDEVAALRLFIDRDLSRQIFGALTRCEISETHYDVGDPAELYEMSVPAAAWANGQSLLTGNHTSTGSPGYVTMGWYANFSDGVSAVFAITNAAVENQFYLDAFLILNNDADSSQPNPSLPPCNSVAEEFRFQYSGITRVVRLVPT